MKPIFRTLMTGVLLVLGSLPSVKAEDIDLFLGSAGASANVLFIIDNSSNWAANNQAWPTDTNPPVSCGSACDKQGYNEIKALHELLKSHTVTAGVKVYSVADKTRVGLMLFNNSTATHDAGYMRVAVNELGQGGGSHREKLISVLESMITNFNTETAASSVNYAAVLFDAFKYFGAHSNPRRTYPGIPPTIANPTYDSVPVFGQVIWGDKDDDGSKPDPLAYTGNTYRSPIDEATSCAKNYIVFIGNGFPAKDDTPSQNMAEVLRKLTYPENSGAPAIPELKMPAYKDVYPVGTYQCKALAQCETDRNAVTFDPAASYCGPGKLDCSFSVAFVCGQGDCKGQNKRVIAQGTPFEGGEVSPGQAGWYGDEFANFIAGADVSPLEGDQNVQIYTIDVFRKSPSAEQTQYMRSIAKYGLGEYYSASDYEQIKNAISDILRKINAVNSVFASASLPVSATNRAQNENQVYIGVFRPDSELNPRWPGNLKRYEVGRVGGKLTLTDRYGLREAVNPATGFLDDCAISFWTEDKGPYWQGIKIEAGVGVTKCTVPVGNPSNSTYAEKADFPDGASVDKGAVSQVLRLGNNPPWSTTNEPTYSPAGRNIVTLNAARTGIVPVATPANDVQKFALGYDVNNERGGGSTTAASDEKSDVRPSVHGDVIHSRPLPINFEATSIVNPKVAVFYGANDGTFRAVDSRSGKEIWALIDPDDYGSTSTSDRMKRLEENSPIMFYPTVDYDDKTGEPLRKNYFFDGSSTAYQSNDLTKAWVYTSMRRGGRMVYALDVSNTFSTTDSKPSLLWRYGCPAGATTATDCTSTNAFAIGETWSTPFAVTVPVTGATDNKKLIVAFGGGYEGGGSYDSANERYNYDCEDQDTKSLTGCDDGSGRKGNALFFVDAGQGVLGKPAWEIMKRTIGQVPGDIAFVDTDYDGVVDYGYAVTTRGYIYRIRFRDANGDPTLELSGTTVQVKAAFVNDFVTVVARTNVGNDGRKFLFAPSLLAFNNRVYVAVGSGDREHPLQTNYPYQQQVSNRFYLFLDNPKETAPALNSTCYSGGVFNLDGTCMFNAADVMGNSDCTVNRVLEDTPNKYGWYFDLASQTAGGSHRGEQVVTSALIATGIIYFSTNTPETSTVCTNKLGVARGYALNILNGSGMLGADSLVCGGNPSGVFAGGGLPPSPVLGRVTYSTGSQSSQTSTICIGCITPGIGPKPPIKPEEIKPPIKPKRTKTYWYNKTDTKR